MRGEQLSSARFLCGSHEARHSHNIDSRRRFTGQFILGFFCISKFVLVPVRMTRDGSRGEYWSSKLSILNDELKAGG
jgi:hypothetical protein